MTRPVIGLSCYLEPTTSGMWEAPAAQIHDWYVDMIQQAGGTLLCIHPESTPDPAILQRVDALVLAGGVDVDARLYGEEPHPKAAPPRTERDTSEIALCQEAHRLGLPTLGICRGLQLMVVAHGGALHQHVPEITELRHSAGAGEFIDHGATFAEGSLAARAVGATCAVVNSAHHQAVRDPGDLTITGWADDGTVEACEDPEHVFYLGVQWHPEVTERRVADAPLITALVTAAQEYSHAARERGQAWR